MKTSVRLLSVIFLSVFLSLFAMPVASASVDDVGKGVNGLLDKIEILAGKTKINELREQALKKFGLLVNPYFKTGFDYTTNVFKSPRKRVEDVIFKFTPGVNLTYTNPLGQVGVSYEAEFLEFHKDGLQDAQNQYFSAFADIHPTDKLSLRVSEQLNDQYATAGAHDLKPINFMDNTVRVSGVYALNDQLSEEIGYQNFVRRYNGDTYDLYDYTENIMFLRSYYKFCNGPKVSIGYDLGFVNYSLDNFDDELLNNRDASYHEFPVGAEGTLPWGDIYYAAYVGPHIRNMQSEDRNGWWGFVSSVVLRKKITKSTATELGFSRRPVEGTFDDQTFNIDRTFWAGVTQVITPKLRGRMKISTSNRHYDNNATVGNVWTHRRDAAFGFGLGLDYAVRKWMILNTDYKIERRNSNISDFDYLDNTLSMGMTMPF